MNYFSGSLVLVLVAGLCIAACNQDRFSNKEPPRAVQGILDLSDWDFEEDGIVRLNGEWEFYWEQLLEPGDFSGEGRPQQTGFFHVPSIWNGYEIEGEELSGDGCATFRLRTELGDPRGVHALRLMVMATAYRIWVNGEFLASNGKVGKSPETMIPQSLPQIATFRSGDPTLDIVLQVSNFFHRKGGIWDVIELGTEKQIHQRQKYKEVFEGVLFGSLLIMALFHFGLFGLRRKDLSTLYFGLFCLLIATRLLVTDECFLIALFPDFSWEIAFKIEYLSFYLALPVFAAFIGKVYPEGISRRILQGSAILGILFSLIVLCTPARIFTYTLVAYEPVTLFVGGYLIYWLIRNLFRGKEGSALFVGGSLVLFLTVINDMLFAYPIVYTGYLVPFGLFIFIFAQSLVSSMRFSRAFRTVEVQSMELQETNSAFREEIAERKRVEEELRQREDELREHRDQLEELVAGRTASLTKTNEQLQREIIERRQAEEARRESEEQYRELVENINEVLYAIDKDGVLTYISPVIESVIGYSPSEIVGRPFSAFVHPEDLPRMKGRFQDILDGERRSSEYRVLTRSGEVRWARTSSRPVLVENRVVGVQGVLIEITERKAAEEERKKLEARIQQADKMEALGNLAGGVAHDLNNILSGIVGYPQLLLMDLPEDSPLRDPLQIIKSSGERAAETVQDLLALARRGVSVSEVVNLNDIISELLKSPEYDQLKLLHPGMEVETDLNADLSNISGSPLHLSKALMNLVSNGAEAMPAGGRLTLSTENCYLDRPIKGYGEVEEGDYVAIGVADTGTGIAPEDIGRVFEPFYTKKQMGRSGTGLGMTVVWGTVQDHNGYIEVQSREGEGTIFTLFFPVTQREPSRDRPDPSIEDYLSKGESILVIDDVEEQQKLAAAILTRLGYSVTTVSSGEEAVEYLQNNSVDLLVLDMIMDPGMDGLDTYRRILARHPGQRAIIASGFSETDRVEEAQRLGAGAYLRKPYLMEKLGMAVRTELDSGH